MNLFWTLLLCALGFQSTVQVVPDDLIRVIPLNYRMDLYTNFGDFNNEFRFTGGVWITVKCLFRTNTITLDAKNIEVGNVTHNSPKINGTILFDQKGDLLTLRLPAHLEKNDYFRVGLSFAGNFEKELKKGFFLSSFKDLKTHKTLYIAESYGQNGNARKIFPCFDNPRYKATFEIAIAHATRYKACSNKPEDYHEWVPFHGQDWVRTFFEKTAPLSTDEVILTVFDTDIYLKRGAPGTNPFGEPPPGFLTELEKRKEHLIKKLKGLNIAVEPEATYAKLCKQLLEYQGKKDPEYNELINTCRLEYHRKRLGKKT